jgi:hypothetical protein
MSSRWPEGAGELQITPARDGAGISGEDQPRRVAVDLSPPRPLIEHVFVAPEAMGWPKPDARPLLGRNDRKSW